MEKLIKEDLLDIIEYEKNRTNYRKNIISYKKYRRISLGPNVTLVFENKKTLTFQIQEIMRAERLVHESQIQNEIDVYFDDCTGYCVADGTAENPISSSDCLSPNEPYIGSIELNESSATFEMVMGEGEDSYCEKWNLTRID